MTLYGPHDQAVLNRIYELAGELQAIYRQADLSSFIADNLLALGRNMSFVHDPEFRAAFDANSGEPEDNAKFWRLHTYCWAGRSALAVPGDFVELGVYKGFYSGVLVDYLRFGECGRELFLVDSFAGLDEDWSDPQERDHINPYYDWDGTFEAVKQRFAAHANVHVIKGVVPEILESGMPEQIAFLHLDLNAAKAERAAIEKLGPRVADGGIVLMDDFGRIEHRTLCETLDSWWREQGHTVLELPTGQGLVIKRTG